MWFSPFFSLHDGPPYQIFGEVYFNMTYPVQWTLAKYQVPTSFFYYDLSSTMDSGQVPTSFLMWHVQYNLLQPGVNWFVLIWLTQYNELRPGAYQFVQYDLPCTMNSGQVWTGLF